MVFSKKDQARSGDPAYVAFGEMAIPRLGNGGREKMPQGIIVNRNLSIREQRGVGWGGGHSAAEAALFFLKTAPHQEAIWGKIGDRDTKPAQ